MKTIKLIRMELRNFKGVAQAEYDFGDRADISGGNGSGKSTIFEAYLWCLFDKNPAGNTPKVQPYDTANEIKHQLTTSVRLYIELDGNPLIVERTLKEEWVKPRGTTELVCKGTKSEYAVNEVPMSKAQYNAKLADILPLDKWFILSSIGIIPAMEQKACRAALQAIAPAIDEQTIAQPFPAVVDALTHGLNIDELQATTKQTKSRAKTELDSIPAAIDAQDRLRVVEDFAAIEAKLAETKTDIAARQAELEQLQTLGDDADRIAKEREIANLRTYLARLNAQISEYETNAQTAYTTDRAKYEQQLQTLAAESQGIAQRITVAQQTAKRYLLLIEDKKQRIATLRDQWKAKNAEAYIVPEMQTVCPTCGQELPAERITEALTKAMQAWNAEKVKSLQAIQHEAEECKKCLNDYETANAQADECDRVDIERAKTIADEVKEIQQAIDNLCTPTTILNQDAEYQTLLAKKQDIESQLAQTTQAAETTQDTTTTQITEITQAIASLQRLREDLLRRLAARDTNRRIDEERARLLEQQRTLADTIAQAEGVEQQILAYRKAKIIAVENGISSLFTMVRWKMYEPNVTNDGEKEICQAIINGVPYDQQNRATQVNAAIDIVNGFAKAYEVSLPLFIDNAESVTDIIPTNGQCITMTVVKNKQLELTNYHK